MSAATDPPPRSDGASRVESSDVELLSFLGGRDVRCPLCGYNLRDLTRAECPECRQRLVLNVGAADPRIHWFLLALAPSIFSGIAAVLLLVPLIAVPATGGGPPPPLIIAADAFGWMSGLVGLGLIGWKLSFIRADVAFQRWTAIVTWTMHVLAAMVLFWLVLA